jgi:hypothetical protein
LPVVPEVYSCVDRAQIRPDHRNCHRIGGVPVAQHVRERQIAAAVLCSQLDHAICRVAHVPIVSRPDAAGGSSRWRDHKTAGHPVDSLCAAPKMSANVGLRLLTGSRGITRESPAVRPGELLSAAG